MNVDGGALEFDAVLNTGQLDDATEETKRRLQGLTDATVEAGDKMDDAFDKAGQSVSELENKIRQLKEQQSELGKIISDASKWGTPPKALTDEYENISREISESEARIAQYRDTVNTTEKAHTSFRSQLRAAREELIQLEQAGLRNTQQFADLQQEVGRLQNAMDDASRQARVLSNDENQFQGVIEGLSGIAGGFSAATGTVGLFAGENENLEKIMTKVQSVMAITIGLQRIAVTLNKDSYFRLVTLTKIQNLYSAALSGTGTALVRFGVSTGVARVAAQALMATLTLGLGVAITAAVTLISKYIDKQKEAKKATEEFNSKLAETAAKPIASINQLSLAWSKLGDNIKAKEKFIKDNKDNFDSLGVSVKNAADAEKLLIDNKEAFIKAQILKAKAMAATELATDKYKAALQKMQGAEAEPEPVKYVGTGQYRNQQYDKGSLVQRFGRSNADPDKLLKDGQIAINKAWEDWNSKQKEYQSELDNAGKKLFEMAATFTVEEQKLLAQIGQSGSKITEGSILAQEKVISALQEEYKNAVTELKRNELAEEIKKQQSLLDKMNILSSSKSTPKAKTDDPFTKDLETKKKAYSDYFKWLNAGYKKEAQQEFAETLKGGNTYLEYLKKLREDTSLTKEQITQITTEIANETNTTIIGVFEKSLQDQLNNAGTVLETLQIIADKRKELESDDSGLKDEKTKVLDNEETDAKKNFDKEAEELLEKYRTFAQQRIDIEKQYQDEIAIMRQAGASQESMDLAKQGYDQALAALDEEIAQKEDAFNNLIRHIGDMSIEQLIKTLEEAKQSLLESDINNGQNSDKSATLRATIKRLQDELKLAQSDKDYADADKSKQWNKTSAAIKKCKSEVDGMIDSMDFLDDSTKEALQAASNVADGAIAMIDGIKALGIGAAQSLSAVEKASVILAIVGAAVQIVTAIFNMASKAEAEHQKALAEVAKNKLAMQREYNLALIEQNLLLEKADTIFGTDNYGKAANAIEVYKDSLRQLKDEMSSEYKSFNLFGFGIKQAISGLESITVKTGHHKTGLFGWGKGADEYTAITDLYDDLITKEGLLNVTRAKSIISTQTMSDENKEALQYMIDLAEEAEKAFEQVKDYLTGIFGELGATMSDALTDAFMNGTDAAKAFSDSVSDMLAKLAQDMIYSVTLAPIMEQAQKDMLEVMKDSSLTDEQKFNKYAALMSGVTADALKQKDTADQLYKTYQEIAKRNGIDIWNATDENTPSSLSGGIKGITQVQADLLAGQTNAMRVNQMESIEIMRNQLAYMASIDARIGVSNQHLENIERNTSGYTSDPLRAEGIINN